MKIISTVVLASLFIETVANLSDGVPVSPAKAFDNRSLQQKRYMTGIRDTIDPRSDDDFSFCGGVLISQSHVLTTMTCTMDGNAKFVSVGAIYINGDKDGDEIKVASVAKHPHFDAQTLSNNFAVLKLARNVNATIRPVKLPTNSSSTIRTGKMATAMGWGLTTQGIGSLELLKVDQKLVSNVECGKKLNSTTIDMTLMCAGGEKDKSPCNGDTGGPLINENGKGDKDDVLIGLISGGIDIGCGTKGYPALYSRVSSALEWINTAMKA